MTKDSYKSFRESVFPIVFVVLFAAAALVAGNGWEAYKCSSLGDTAGIESKFTIVNGCFVKLGDKWVPASRWRALDQSHD